MHFDLVVVQKDKEMRLFKNSMNLMIPWLKFTNIKFTISPYFSYPILFAFNSKSFSFLQI